MARALDFVGADLSERDLRLCFLWSRMAVIDGRTKRGHLRESSLPFEGFLEALCRMATMQALPVDGEITAAGFESAGPYVSWLAAEDSAVYHQRRVERATTWGQEQTRQSTARCVAHVIDVIKYKLEVATTAKGTAVVGTPQGPMTEKKVKQWLDAWHYGSR